MRKLRLATAVAPFAVALALGSPAARAAPVFGIGATATSQAQVTGVQPDSCNQSTPGQATASCSASITASDGSGSTQITVNAALGTLGTVASATASHMDTDAIDAVNTGSRGNAQFWDQITVHSPASLSGSLEFTLALAGDGVVGISDYAVSLVRFDATLYGTQGFGETGNALYSRIKTLDVAGLHDTTTDLYGNWPHPRVPFTLSYDSAAGEWKRTVYFSLNFAVWASCVAQYGYMSGSESCDASASYGDGLKVTRIRALDGGGNPAANVTLTSDSGHDYNAPEPGSLAQIGSALLALLGTSRRRAAQARRGRVR